MTTRITYEGAAQGPVTVTLGQRPTGRQEGDVALVRALATDCPLRLVILVRADGTIDEWYADWGVGDNTYWHLTHGSQDDASGRYKRPKELTPAQRETLIRIWGGDLRPYGVRGTCGAPVMRWVKPTRDELQAILGHMPALA